MAAAAAAGAALTVNVNNRSETQKLYMTLLQFSLYDNPSRQYSRKIKLKRVYPSLQSAPGGASSTGSIEYVIASPQQLHIVPASSIRNDGVKTRKKMKIMSETSVNKEQEGEPESPKSNKNPSTSLNDEEPEANVIIFKPIEHEKMKNSKFSLAELRTLCTYYSIKKSGTKPELTQRIYTHLKQSYYIVRIQRNFRNYISSKYRILGGPGYLHTSNCVNDTDFYTFDKLSDIKPTELFTYRDNDNKVYGFHIASIFHLIISSYPNITNPYNRKLIPAGIINNLYEKLIYGSLLGFRVSVKLDDNDEEESTTSQTTSGTGSGTSAVGGGSGTGLTREKQEELFIVDLFQHINTLGNYSDSEWFITLQRADLIRFIRNVHDIWYYRANLSQEMKERICPPNGNPFMLNNVHVNLNVITLLTDPEIRTICVSIIDRMVRRGVSREDQCLGAFYVLATLTIVSQDARNALPWLYEAVM
jgi:hypothetical protein